MVVLISVLYPSYTHFVHYLSSHDSIRNIYRPMNYNFTAAFSRALRNLFVRAIVLLCVLKVVYGLQNKLGAHVSGDINTSKQETGEECIAVGNLNALSAIYLV